MKKKKSSSTLPPSLHRCCVEKPQVTSYMGNVGVAVTKALNREGWIQGVAPMFICEIYTFFSPPACSPSPSRRRKDGAERRQRRGHITSPHTQQCQTALYLVRCVLLRKPPCLRLGVCGPGPPSPSNLF